MPLPDLYWKMLPEYTLNPNSRSNVDGLLDGIFTLFNSNTYIDGSPRVTGSGVAWTFFRTSSLLGGVTEAVYGYPPTMSVMSQSVMFAGTASLISTASFYYVPHSSSDARSIVTNSLYVAVQKYANCFEYRDWKTQAFFNSASGLTPFISSSGYAAIKAIEIPINTIRAWECGEAVAVTLDAYTTNSIFELQSPFLSSVSTASTFAGIAGAILNPQSENTTFDCESDGRLYGILTSGRLIARSFISQSSVLPQFTSTDMSGTGSVPKCLVYKPNSNERYYASVLNPNRIMNMVSNKVSGKIPTFPIYYKISGSTADSISGSNRFLGRLRNINQLGYGSATGTSFQVSSSIVGYSIGSADFATYNALFLPSQNY